MQAAQATPATPEPAAPARDTQATLADCDARLARYQATLDAGGDPQTIAEWTRQVKAERAAALARDATQTLRSPSRRLTEDDIRALITGLGDLRDIICDAEAPVKAAIYEQLGLQVTYLPEQDKLRADVPPLWVGQRQNSLTMGYGLLAGRGSRVKRADLPVFCPFQVIR
jgi:site-specific DNA recombinase